MATFQAPPWCPPPAITFLRLIIVGAFDPEPISLPLVFTHDGHRGAEVKAGLTGQFDEKHMRFAGSAVAFMRRPSRVTRWRSVNKPLHLPKRHMSH
jgi:hypothetical protein